MDIMGYDIEALNFAKKIFSVLEAFRKDFEYDNQFLNLGEYEQMMRNEVLKIISALLRFYNNEKQEEIIKNVGRVLRIDNPKYFIDSILYVQDEDELLHSLLRKLPYPIMHMCQKNEQKKAAYITCMAILGMTLGILYPSIHIDVDFGHLLFSTIRECYLNMLESLDVDFSDDRIEISRFPYYEAKKFYMNHHDRKDFNETPATIEKYKELLQTGVLDQYIIYSQGFRIPFDEEKIKSQITDIINGTYICCQSRFSDETPEIELTEEEEYQILFPEEPEELEPESEEVIRYFNFLNKELRGWYMYNKERIKDLYEKFQE